MENISQDLTLLPGLKPGAPSFPDTVDYDIVGTIFSSSVFFTIHQSVVGKDVGLNIVRRQQRYSIDHSMPGHPQLIKWDYRWSGGMTWLELRDNIKKKFMDGLRDMDIIAYVKNAIMTIVPVRTGKLLDIILDSMTIERHAYYKTRYWAIFSFTWTADRPYPIGGNVRHSGQFGEGEQYTPSNVIPNVHRLYNIGPNMAMYVLTDPMVLNDPKPSIMFIAKEELFADFKREFDNLTVLIYVRTNLDTGHQTRLK